MAKLKRLFPSLTTGMPLIGVLLLAASFPAPGRAQVSGAGSTSANFEKITMGARAAGMGDGFTAVADDATAIYWNPAGLVLARGTQFSLTHGEWLVGVTHEYFAFSQNLERDGAFGGSLGYLGTGAFPSALETPSGAYGGAGDNISASSYTATAAYAQRLGNWIPGSFANHSLLGLTATVVGQNVVNVGSAGIAFNLGYMYEIQRKVFYLGALLSNVGTSVQDFAQPLHYKLGASYRLRNLLLKKDYDLIALDTNGYIDTGIGFNLGDEYKLTFGRNDVAVRLGYRTGNDLSDVTGLTAGVGIAHRFDDFQAGLDYAFVPYGVLGLTHRITLNVVIGGAVIKPEASVTVQPAFVLGTQTAEARFSTKSEEPISRYKITVLDSTGMLVKTFEGKGNPPGRYAWDGRNQAGELVPQGNYTFNLEVADDDDLTAKAPPAWTFAKWVPKKVPYQYTFQVSGDLLFDSGKAELLQRGYEAIQKAAAAIHRRYPDSVIIIAGHTDDERLSKGSRYADNLQLSLARAQAVKDYLARNGMDPAKLSVVGYGETRPVASNDNPAGRAKNRRVELVVSGVMEATATDLIREGLIMYNQRNYREALDRFLKALESDSRNAQAYQLAGNCYLNLGGKDQAVAAYRKSLKYDPHNADLRQFLDQMAPSQPPAQAPQDNPAVPPPQAPSKEVPASSSPAASAQPAPSAPATQAAPSGVPQPVDGN